MPPRKYDAAFCDELARLFGEGWTCKQLAKAYGISGGESQVYILMMRSPVFKPKRDTTIREPVELLGGRQHGTRSGYKVYGCRCPECRAWSAADGRDKRARRKLR